MAKPPSTHFGNRNDDATSDAARSLRLRFDPPPPNGLGEGDTAPQFDSVINEVEQLSLGIDTMLRRAGSTTLGPKPSDDRNPTGVGLDEDDDESIDDEPMMAMFDEESPPPSTPTAPTDIHAIDRLLATRAEAVMNAEVAAATSSTDEQSGIALAAESSPPSASREDQAAEEVMLEGDFEDINALIEKSVPAFVPPAADMPVPVASPPAKRQAEPARVEEATRHETPFDQISATETAAAASNENADRIDAENLGPPPMLDLSLAPSQAQGIAAALAAASAGGADIHPPAPAAHAPAPISAVPAPSVPLREEPTPAVSPVQHVQKVSVPAAETTIKEVGVRPRSKHFASIGCRIVEVIALTNLPLRMVPKSMQHAVNMIAVSLALWAPAVWALGPKIASARQATHAVITSHEGGHGETASKADAGAHGESKDAHESKSSASAKKSSSSSKKASSKKSSAKKADAAPSGGH